MHVLKLISNGYFKVGGTNAEKGSLLELNFKIVFKLIHYDMYELVSTDSFKDDVGHFCQRHI